MHILKAAINQTTSNGKVIFGDGTAGNAQECNYLCIKVTNGGSAATVRLNGDDLKKFSVNNSGGYEYLPISAFSLEVTAGGGVDYIALVGEL